MPILGIIASSKLPAVNATSYESIATVTVGSGGSSSITFSSIPSTYKHLQIRYIALPTSSNAVDMKINFNSDTATNYAYHSLYGTGAAAAALAGSTTAKILIPNGLGNSSYTSMFSAGIIDILDYASTNKNKTVRCLSGFDTNNATTSINNEIIALSSGLWTNSSTAISSITLAADVSTNVAQYSSFALYGIKGA
jgi:hypothetical protein